MNGDAIRSLRKRRGWTQKQLGELLNRALGTRYDPNAIGKWEREVRQLPAPVDEFLEQLEIEETAASLRGENGDHAGPASTGASGPFVFGPEPDPGVGPGQDDAPPAPPGASGSQLPLPSGDPTLARVCEELWELISTGVGMLGAVTGNQALVRDGEIVYGDKQALGRAWGKLAETNTTFRRMLLASTTSGAWLEVAMVSGITFGKCARNHQAYARAAAAQQVEQAEHEFVQAAAERANAGAGVGVHVPPANEGGFADGDSGLGVAAA